MIHFDKELLKEARAIFSTVYVDTETPEMYIGSETAADGDRIRIYPTSWEYEDPIIVRSDEALKKLINEEHIFCNY